MFTGLRETVSAARRRREDVMNNTRPDAFLDEARLSRARYSPVTGPTYALTATVLNASYSRYSGQTSWRSETNRPGNCSARSCGDALLV